MNSQLSRLTRKVQPTRCGTGSRTFQKAELVGLEDVVIVKRHENGKVKINQAKSHPGVGAASGRFGDRRSVYSSLRHGLAWR